MNRARALIICTRPRDHAPARVREAASYPSARSDATEEEQRVASEATGWLQGKRDEPKQAAVKQKRKK